jgi:gluconolactonase
VTSETGIESLLAPGAALRRLATGAVWSEGPVWIPALGVVRWSDIPGNRILQVQVASGETSVYRDDVEFTNGRTLDAAGAVIQCSHGRRALERDVDGVVTTLVDRWGEARFNSPNDVVVKSDGTIWFTDPPYGITFAREGHPGESEYGGNYVFRFDPVSGSVAPVVTDMEEPNGLAFSPDESILYVSDTSLALRQGGNHHIRAYDVIDGAACVDGRVFAVVDPGLSDGFRVDERGRLWTSSADSVQVLSPAGARLGAIPVPEVVGNLCFGGQGGGTLFIAASTSLYAIETRTRDAAAALLGGRDPRAGTAHKPLVVVMGVSGSGKSTVGGALADELGVPFVDADDLHPAANVSKMAAGHPLTDDDRWPWLARVAATLSAAHGTGMVIACSALRLVYREAILVAEPATRFVFLSGSRELLAERMLQRPGHFMPASLLDSQLATLEPLAAHEPGVTVSLDSGAAPAELARLAAAALAR